MSQDDKWSERHKRIMFCALTPFDAADHIARLEYQAEIQRTKILELRYEVRRLKLQLHGRH